MLLTNIIKNEMLIKDIVHPQKNAPVDSSNLVSSANRKIIPINPNRNRISASIIMCLV